MSIHISKRVVKRNWPIIILAAFILLVISLTAYQDIAFAGNSSSDPLRPPDGILFQGPYPPAPAPSIPSRDDAKCKMLVYPTTITLGEPFEVCWVGHKFSSVALGPDRALTPSESSPYLKTLDGGKVLNCNSFLVPSISNSTLNPGVFDFRCTGPAGTILATTVKVVQP